MTTASGNAPDTHAGYLNLKGPELVKIDDDHTVGTRAESRDGKKIFFQEYPGNHERLVSDSFVLYSRNSTGLVIQEFNGKNGHDAIHPYAPGGQIKEVKPDYENRQHWQLRSEIKYEEKSNAFFLHRTDWLPVFPSIRFPF